MSGRGGVRLTATLHIGGDVQAWVQPLPTYNRVVVHLDHRASLHLDRDGIAALTAALERAQTELDAAQDEMAAAYAADLVDESAERISA